MVLKSNRVLLAGLLAAALSLSACQTIDVYEQVETIPGHEWSSTFKPRFQFKVQDTSAPYQLNIVVRHSEQYPYRNLWLNIYAQAPGDTMQKFTVELPLASGDRGWLGTGMDDLYEHQIALTLDPGRFNFNRSGDYQFTVEQIMREDPLPHVFNIGLGVEKK